MVAIFNIYTTIYFESPIIFERQSEQTEAGKKLHNLNIFILSFYNKTAVNKRVVVGIFLMDKVT